MAQRDTKNILAILNELGNGPVDSERRERRRAAFPYAATALLIGIPSTPRIKVVTRNLSTSGVGLLTHRVFQKGEVFVLPLVFPGVKTKLALCRVVFARYVSAATYDVGAKFLAALDSDGEEQVRVPAGWLQQAHEAIVKSAARTHASSR